MAVEAVVAAIRIVRGQRVLLDEDLAVLYGVETKTLVRAVSRHAARFPDDFMFRLSDEEFAAVRVHRPVVGRGGRRYAPYAFTEQGVAMLSSVLNSPRAIAVNIEIMRTFVRLREVLASHEDLAHRLDDLEFRYDEQFGAVFDAIRQLMLPPSRAAQGIGFTGEPEPPAGS